MLALHHRAALLVTRPRAPIRRPARHNSLHIEEKTSAHCRAIVRTGGPAAAVENITASRTFTEGRWAVDRSVEKWGVTQHPGGYLRRAGPAMALETRWRRDPDAWAPHEASQPPVDV